MKLFFKILILALPVLSLAQSEPLLKGFPDTSGNSIRHLSDGKLLQEAREDLLAHAKKSIYVSAFSLSTDVIGKSLFETLCQKAKDGLDVRLIYDYHNNQSYFDNATKLKECGAYVLNFRPGNRWYALHEKILVVDGERFISGGSGYSLKYLYASPDSYKAGSDLLKIRSEGWYDSDYLLEGPAACQIHQQFRNNFITIANQWADYNPDIHWYGPKNFAEIHTKYYGLGRFKDCASKTVKGEARAITIHNNPHKTPSSHRPILKAHLAAIDQTVTGETINLYAPYFVPGTKFVKALVNALNRGVEVTVITNSVESNDEKSFAKKLFIGMMEALEPAIAAGLKIHLWTQNATIHRKGGQIGKVAFYGSDNLDNRAQEYQAEVVVYTDSEEVVKGVIRDYARDLTRSKPLTYDYVYRVYREASFLDKLIGKRFKKFL